VQNYCEVITIGDELLIGQVVDTNSAWIGRELNKIGFEIIQKTSISDSSEHIVAALDAAKTRARIILITGGLGPTKDDLTKQTLVKYFNCGWRRDEEVYTHLVDFFTQRGLPMLDVNLEQATVPDICTTIFNHHGTAPGMWFTDAEGRIYVSMPGVPNEMVAMMEGYVLPHLEKMAEGQHIIHKTLLTAGIGESFLSKKIARIEDALPPHIKLAYLPHFSTVRLRLTARGTNEAAMQAEIDEIVKQMYNAVGEFITADEDVKLEELIGKLLKQQGKTLATAESCTGGYIAHLITSIAGSSAYFKGSVVSYANEVKIHQLGVPESVLKTVGAVSQETVEQMVKGVSTLLNTDFAIATSGIAGPDGGTPEKPVGTVWIAVGTKTEAKAEKFNFRGTRQAIIERSAVTALNMLRKFILETQ
jgi:nicotinamide-nucleotide amidase